MEHEEFIADAKQLRTEAEKEPSRRGLEDYSETIRVLKEDKGFSFREIATWLQQRGLNTDHNAVWRAYSKAIPRDTVGGSRERIERYERKTIHGGAMPWLEES
jgi:hypothetical protein